VHIEIHKETKLNMRMSVNSRMRLPKFILSRILSDL